MSSCVAILSVTYVHFFLWEMSLFANYEVPWTILTPISNYSCVSFDVEGLLHIGLYCASFQSPFYDEANIQNPSQ